MKSVYEQRDVYPQFTVARPVFHEMISDRVRVVSRECDEQLAEDFTLPAVAILNHHAARVGMTRETFEQVRHLLKRGGL
jgi:hypothetical protein